MAAATTRRNSYTPALGGPVDVAPPVPTGNTTPMPRPYDDDDWVGTPPEGRHPRSAARPEFWWRQRPVAPAAAGIGLVLLIVLVVVLLG